ncbi:MAG: hypothetical protein A2341_20930 [Deltaproteobacteria bacterium RIFOXYB12_FULL_58_9]|nr:MAG: hypothetical protein A2341_20930 [Deltaproteobacteria bacterium RIFOXYB12_FULL_58_9]
MRWPLKLLMVGVTASVAGYTYWKIAIPKHRVAIRSELIMLGDLDDDKRWTDGDLQVLDTVLKEFFVQPAPLTWRLDLNQNGLVDGEDLNILQALVNAHGDPYAAELTMTPKGPFPRPREFYRYVALNDYRPRPLWALPYPPAEDSALTWLADFQPPPRTDTYALALNTATRAEAIRFDQAYRRRQENLLPVEREYADRKLARVEELYKSGRSFELLLALMDLTEDAETLAAPREPNITLALLTFRDHLRAVLDSEAYAKFDAGETDWSSVLQVIFDHLENDLDFHYDFKTLSPPRNFTNLENYLERAEWQYYKTSVSDDDFLTLIAFAQNDPRYLRAVSRTSKRSQDPYVENHNLPMVLLFREAVRIEGGDKKKAVGLLDEAIRIPYAWIRSIPRTALPGSLALDNFLLPGNMEDGADKSRHWNVFGGICLYKSPEEALDLALRREMQDLRNVNYSTDGMREFVRDMIANLNGMYHVMTVDPELLDR